MFVWTNNKVEYNICRQKNKYYYTKKYDRRFIQS